MPVLPLDCHLPTQNTTHTIKLRTNTKRNKGYRQFIYIYIYISHVNVAQTVPDISPLIPMHQDPLLVCICGSTCLHVPVGYAGISRWRHNMPAVVCRPGFRFACRALSSARCHFQHSLVVPGAALRGKLTHIYVKIVRRICTQTLTVIDFRWSRDNFLLFKWS